MTMWLELGTSIELFAAELHRPRRRDQGFWEMADFWHGFAPLLVLFGRKFV
jgi:hypothetical protein